MPAAAPHQVILALPMEELGVGTAVETPPPARSTNKSASMLCSSCLVQEGLPASCSSTSLQNHACHPGSGLAAFSEEHLTHRDCFIFSHSDTATHLLRQEPGVKSLCLPEPEALPEQSRLHWPHQSDHLVGEVGPDRASPVVCPNDDSSQSSLQDCWAPGLVSAPEMG